MSHHLDTPLAAQNGQLYIDDLYVFGADDATVLVMDVNSTITGAQVRPGFHPEARYEFKLHLDGAADESVTYRVSFGEPDHDRHQTVRLHALLGAEAADESAEGELLLEGSTGEACAGGDTRLWAGRVGDPFYIDLSLLARVNDAIAKGSAVDLSTWQPASAKNSFDNTTVESIVLAISHRDARVRPGTVLGVWCATRLATDAGGWRQVNRAGHPMMWPIFWPDDTDFSNPANTRLPRDDVAAVGANLGEKVAAVVLANGTEVDAAAYGAAVASRLLPDTLPFVVGTGATYGFAGFNGRTLADNAPEVMLSLVSGMAVPSGLTPAVSKHLRAAEFPYVVSA